VGVSAWTIWRSGPLLGASTDDPYGDPSEWTTQELRIWLNAVGGYHLPFEVASDLKFSVRALLFFPPVEEYRHR